MRDAARCGLPHRDLPTCLRENACSKPVLLMGVADAVHSASSFPPTRFFKFLAKSALVNGATTLIPMFPQEETSNRPQKSKKWQMYETLAEEKSRNLFTVSGTGNPAF